MIGYRWSWALLALLVAAAIGAVGAETRDLVPLPGAGGLYKKVIVCGDDATLRKPDGSQDPVAPFSIFFQLALPDSHDQKGEWILVGDNDGVVLGEIKRDAVLEWNTRYVLKPTPPQGDAKFTIKALEPRAFTATYEGDGSDRTAITPILRQRCVREFESMPDAGFAVRFGLVEYRDSSPDLEFVARLDTPLTDVVTFEKKVNALAATNLCSEETSEDVLAGLLKAIEEGGWSQNSSKHIILMGDASAHLSGPKNTTGLSIESLLSRAQPGVAGNSKTTLACKFIHAVRGIQPSDELDGPKCAEQFKKLSENQGNLLGFYMDVDLSKQVNVEKAVRQVMDFLRTAFARVKSLRTGNAKKLDDMTKADRGTGQLAQAMYRITMAAGQPPVMTMERGIAGLRTANGQLLAQPAILVSEDDLSRFESTLNLVRQSLRRVREPARNVDVAQLLRALQSAVAAVMAGQELNPDVSVGDLVAVLPFKTEALRMSPVDLARMNAEDFEKWLGRLKEAQEFARSLLHEPAKSWIVVSEKANNRKFAFVLVDDLP